MFIYYKNYTAKNFYPLCPLPPKPKFWLRPWCTVYAGYRYQLKSRCKPDHRMKENEIIEMQMIYSFKIIDGYFFITVTSVFIFYYYCLNFLFSCSFLGARLNRHSHRSRQKNRTYTNTKTPTPEPFKTGGVH